ncbi:pyridoxal phosphate-dependent aminotransferase [Pseudoflavonifractor phocaeensis]|uniref:pyridoxal phosphate-dependent aminotransferase n=1 Tax=Pseudoflavonifractor phocaeensis TaxID=1870988 RepID=UPI001F47EE91|nr:pyridoxal phosphate-dependent aminotransferase [Pseudoflavonifractor phocaeensis]MCF2660557.1 pyridoxal phosphate-dependent aminotransferase [Pseudoflavonifractor phocaeensis]
MVSSYDLNVGAKRLEKVEPSLIRTVLDRTAVLRGEGKPVIAFSAGEPDFNTPSDIKEATIRAITNNQTKYGSNQGYPPLRKLLQGYIKEETGIDYDPNTEILITSSAAEALNNSIMAFVDEGDEVIVLTPAFVSYKSLINMCGAKFVDIPLSAENGFQVDIEAVKAAITDKTKMLVMNSPSNPTGAVFSYDNLKQLCELAVEHNFLILSDEIYSRLVYDGAEFHSIASFPGMKERSIIVSGFSKTFAMTGWRLGYIATSAKLRGHILRVHQYSTTCSPTFIQVGLAESMNTPNTKKQVEEMLAAFANRRKLIMKLLDEIPGLTYVKPYGAFYIMVDVSALNISSMDFSMKLLEEKYVATVPAVGLDDHTGKYVRFSYATSEENIVEGFRRIKEMVEEMRKA